MTAWCLAAASILGGGQSPATAATRTAVFGVGTDAFSLELVLIGAPGNPLPAPPLAGAVNYTFWIGKHEVSTAAVEAANRERYPDLMLGVAWNQRPAHDDMASLMLGVRLPVRPGSRQQPRLREMEAMAAEADAAALDLANGTWADLVEARAAVERARALGGLYATAILPQANAAVEAALSAYRVGEVDYSTLIESQMTVNRYEIALVRITAEYHQAMARIDALLGRAGGDR